MRSDEYPCVTMIGDVVGSRQAPDRAAVHRRLGEQLSRAAERFEALSPWRITAGDEFQAGFASVGSALRAATWIRLALLEDEESPIDVRLGLGHGAVRVLEEEPRFEDGPGWWAARAALEAVEAESRRPGRDLRRVSFSSAEEEAGSSGRAALVEALLNCRDQVVGSLSSRSVRLLLGVLEGRSQAELAAAEGISPSAVSQRWRRDGLAVLVDVEELLREV